MFTQCPSKGLGQGGKPCQETGGRIGKAIPTSMAKASLFRSPQVMEGLSLATTLCLITGNLDKYLKGHNSRYHLSPISVFARKSQKISHRCCASFTCPCPSLTPSSMNRKQTKEGRSFLLNKLGQTKGLGKVRVLDRFGEGEVSCGKDRAFREG
ncbi:hypothetical protein Fmac_032477 [Flemingia macrophylla]|uniref:Uncharacterized protein n=1 Tax=Flemingia macrophylla TaxID=520843 RepID=A0ABD1L541_9FABA